MIGLSYGDLEGRIRSPQLLLAGQHAHEKDWEPGPGTVHGHPGIKGTVSPD